eukprot:m.55299 g.55299  ORF g.55299 m.55299 type:complete len:281 (-) comp12522_c0_seq1:125-967(-)
MSKPPPAGFEGDLLRLWEAPRHAYGMTVHGEQVFFTDGDSPKVHVHGLDGGRLATWDLRGMGRGEEEEDVDVDIDDHDEEMYAALCVDEERVYLVSKSVPCVVVLDRSTGRFVTRWTMPQQGSDLDGIADAGSNIVVVNGLDVHVVSKATGEIVRSFAHTAEVGKAVDIDVVNGRAYVTDSVEKCVYVFDFETGERVNVWNEIASWTPCAVNAVEDCVVVTDISTDCGVHVFDPDGKLVRTLGRGHGKGEDQFDTPNFLATRGPELWVFDCNNTRVKVLT